MVAAEAEVAAVEAQEALLKKSPLSLTDTREFSLPEAKMTIYC